VSRIRSSTDTLEIIAHRGYSARAPENTLAAVERALVAGADAVEWDVHVSADGVPVLFHDEDLPRTSDGAGLLREHSYEQLRALDVGRWFGAAFAGERIASLADALARVKGRVGRVYTEVKGWREDADLDRILADVRAADVAGHVFISLEWSALAHIGRADPTAGLGYIVEAHERFDEALERATGDARALLDLDRRLILERPALARRALDRGIPLAVWTVNDPAEADRLRAAGVTRFTTDQVETLLSWRGAVA
jgi:glycerophosphoryl diester phosphodiesterase